MAFKESKKLVAILKKYTKEIDVLVTIAGNDAKNHFTQSFRDGGFTDESFSPWKKRKRTTDNYKKGSQRNASGGVQSLNVGRGTLIGKGTGTLRKSINFRKKGRFAVQIFTSVPYAQIHNEGLMGKAWGKYPFKMPKRQFIGYSGKLNRKIIAKFDLKIKRIFVK